MGSLNKVLLIGNLGKEAETRYTPDGLAVVKFPLATTEYFKSQSGEKSEKTTWHNIVVFGKTGENVVNFLNKGKQVFIEGRISTSQYDDKDGITRYRTEIIANSIILLGAKPASSDNNDGNEDYQEQAQTQAKAKTSSPQEDDDIPFSRSPVL